MQMSSNGKYQGRDTSSKAGKSSKKASRMPIDHTDGSSFISSAPHMLFFSTTLSPFWRYACPIL